MNSCDTEKNPNPLENICPICFDDLVKNEDPDAKKSKSKAKSKAHELDLVKNKIITLDCGHKFHYECIVDWFKQKKLKTLKIF